MNKDTEREVENFTYLQRTYLPTYLIFLSCLLKKGDNR